MKQTQIYNFNFIVFFACFLIDSAFPVSSSSHDSQPALIPTYDTAGEASQKLISEPLKSNIYSESLEPVTTTTPLESPKQNDSSLNENKNEYSITSKPEPELETDYHDDPSPKLISETKSEEHMKPQAYIDSIVNPEPYSKLLEFDEKPKEKPDVRVTIYHHQGISDPVSKYGSGKPWNFYGTGYGIHYEHNKDGSYGREKGYQFEKAHGREFCDKKECQHKEQDKTSVAASSEKSPVESHVEGLLKHNNVDIQNWYREGSHKPETDKPSISTSKAEHFAPKPLPDPVYPQSISIPSKTEVAHKPPVWSERPPPTLHKISSFIPNHVPTYISSQKPQPETNLYTNFKPEPKIYKPYFYPKDYHFAHSETVEAKKPEIKIQPKDFESPFVSMNRYNSPYTPKFWVQPHAHVHSDFHSNNNNFRNIDPKRSLYKQKIQPTVTHYTQPTNDFFDFDRSFWPNTIAKPEPGKNSLGRAQIYGGSTFMPKYIPRSNSPNEAFFSTSAPTLYPPNTFDPFSWNPYS